MSSRLAPCAACNRHVRESAEACPFCLAERAPALRAPAALAPPPSRMSSLAVMTFRAAALGVALNACGGDTEGPKPGGKGGSSGQSGSTGGTGATAGTPPDTSTGGTSASGGTTGQGSGGIIQVSGAPNNNTGGGPVPIYRATPRG